MWGGKRKGAGRAHGDERDWKKYKTEAKRKKLVESSKSSMNIKSFFSSKAKNSSECTEDLKSHSQLKQKEDMTQVSDKDCMTREEEVTRQKMSNHMKQNGDMTLAPDKEYIRREEEEETRQKKGDMTQASVKDCLRREEVEEETMQKMSKKLKQKEDMTQATGKECRRRQEGETKEKFNLVEEFDVFGDSYVNSFDSQSLGGDPSSTDGGFEQRFRTQSGTRQQTQSEDEIGDARKIPSQSTVTNFLPILKLGYAPPSPLPFFSNRCKASGGYIILCDF